MSLDVSLVVDGEEVFERNITHNLGKMAKEAGFYFAAWCPEEAGLSKAKQLSFFLEVGIISMLRNKRSLEKFNAENGWGEYKDLLEFAIAYAIACNQYPDAEVVVSR